MFLVCVFYLITFSTHSNANVDIKVVIDKITTELGSGRLTVSSYLHFTAEHCLEHLDKSLTVGQESLNCYANAYKSFEGTQNVTEKAEKQKSNTEEENWELQCKVWPLLSACHRKTTLPATDQCYQELFNKINTESGRQNLDFFHESSENRRRGSDALRFTDAYISFQCKDIHRTVGVLELARPRRLICFKDLKEHITNCSKKSVDEFGNTQFSLRRTLLLIRHCYETEYTKYSGYCSGKNSNAGKVLPFIKDMFEYIDKDMFRLEQNKHDELNYSRNSEAQIPITMDEKQIEETKRNINDRIKDDFLKDFLTNIIIPEETEQNISSETSSEVTDSPFPSVIYQDDHHVYPDPENDRTTTAQYEDKNTHHSHIKNSNGADKSTSGILIIVNLVFLFSKFVFS